MPTRSLLALAALALGLLLPPQLLATTVAPPQFESLVSQADFVVNTVVKSVTAERQVRGANTVIITKVTLAVREVVTGNPPPQLVLEMLGGKVGDEELVVHGSPQFQVGDEDILFVQGNGRQFSPLVAMMYGRYPVVHLASTGKEYIARSNGAALYNVKDVALPIEKEGAHTAAMTPMTRATFISEIRQSFRRAHHPQKLQ